MASICYYCSAGSCYTSDHSGGFVENCTSNYNESDIKHVIDGWSSQIFTDNELKEIKGYKSRLIKKLK